MTKLFKTNSSVKALMIVNFCKVVLSYISVYIGTHIIFIIGFGTEKSAFIKIRDFTRRKLKTIHYCSLIFLENKKLGITHLPNNIMSIFTCRAICIHSYHCDTQWSKRDFGILNLSPFDTTEYGSQYSKVL